MTKDHLFNVMSAAICAFAGTSKEHSPREFYAASQNLVDTYLLINNFKNQDQSKEDPGKRLNIRFAVSYSPNGNLYSVLGAAHATDTQMLRDLDEQKTLDETFTFFVDMEVTPPDVQIPTITVKA